MLNVECVVSICHSPGDALRELDGLGKVRSDPFILINGDVVSNMDLNKAITFHKERRKLDETAIMTVVLKEVQLDTAARPVLDDLVVAMDSDNAQILLFNNTWQKDAVTLPLEIVDEHPSMVLHTNLLDCHIDICSPEFLIQFGDNFDFKVKSKSHTIV